MELIGEIGTFAYTSTLKKMESAQINEIQLFNLLKGKLGETETGLLISYVKNETNDNTMLQTSHLVTKADIERTQSRLVLWSFVFWATQLAAIVVLLKL